MNMSDMNVFAHQHEISLFIFRANMKMSDVNVFVRLMQLHIITVQHQLERYL